MEELWKNPKLKGPRSKAWRTLEDTRAKGTALKGVERKTKTGSDVALMKRYKALVRTSEKAFRVGKDSSLR